MYSTTTGDGGVDDITLSSPASGRYVRLLGTQRGTMYGYSLYEMEVYGGAAVNHAPVVSSFSKSGTQDLPLAFAAGDFAGAFADPDAGDSLQKVKITSLPGHGVLTLGSTPVTVNQEVPVAQIGTLDVHAQQRLHGFRQLPVEWLGWEPVCRQCRGGEPVDQCGGGEPGVGQGRRWPRRATAAIPASNVTDGNAEQPLVEPVLG